MEPINVDKCDACKGSCVQQINEPIIQILICACCDGSGLDRVVQILQHYYVDKAICLTSNGKVYIKGIDNETLPPKSP